MDRLNIKFDIERLRESTREILSRVEFYGKPNVPPQIGLVHKPSSKIQEDKIFGSGSVGRTVDEEGKRIHFETEFTVFNEDYKDTYFYEVWKALQQLPGGIGRFRLMLLRPRTLLSFHHDFEMRFHIPIITNPRCFFLVNNVPEEFPELFGTLLPTVNVFHLPADGSVYKFNATHYHTAINAGKTDRIHLVVSKKDGASGHKI
jgi:hypothetical protein